MMSMSMSHRQENRLDQRLEQKQLLAQTARELQIASLDLRISLRQELLGGSYRPQAVCPACEHKLTPLEIMEGFNNDPNDFTTKCPLCGKRFMAQLILPLPGGNIELIFYCRVQVLARLTLMHLLSPEQIAQQYPSEYRSAVMHFGNLHEAFGILGIEYQFPRAALDWRNKVLAFVGKLPDPEIARVAGVSATTIRRWRQQHKIPAYNQRDELEKAINNL